MPRTMGNPSEFDAGKLQLPPHWIDTKEIRTQYCKFLAEVKRLDNQVGDIMQLLKETGQEKNTILKLILPFERVGGIRFSLMASVWIR